MLGKKLNIRVFSWLQGGLSWAYVVSRLAQAMEELGHNVYCASTNGVSNNDGEFLNEKRMLESVVALQGFGPGKKQIDLDWCYTIPPNLPKRFLANSKKKGVIYNYETDLWPEHWRAFYNVVDYFFPSSNFSAEVFVKNGVPKDKIFVIPHGVDTTRFNPNVKPVKLRTNKKFKFVSVTAPHVRKNIPGLLKAYCEAFTRKDDVCLVLKTKIYKHKDGEYSSTNPKGRKGFEIVLGDTIIELARKFGENMPEIELLTGHVDNVASIYNACDCHISATGSEGWGLIFTESMACGLLNIAPRYSGQLHFMNDQNALLCDVSMRKAKRYEQYWAYNNKAIISEIDNNHMKELMWHAYRNKDPLLKEFAPNMKKMVKQYSWKNAAKQMIDVVNEKAQPYKPGSYILHGS